MFIVAEIPVAGIVISPLARVRGWLFATVAPPCHARAEEPGGFASRTRRRWTRIGSTSSPRAFPGTSRRPVTHSVLLSRMCHAGRGRPVGALPRKPGTCWKFRRVIWCVLLESNQRPPPCQGSKAACSRLYQDHAGACRFVENPLVFRA